MTADRADSAASIRDHGRGSMARIAPHAIAHATTLITRNFVVRLRFAPHNHDLPAIASSMTRAAFILNDETPRLSMERHDSSSFYHVQSRGSARLSHGRFGDDASRCDRRKVIEMRTKTTTALRGW
jgi:hypothetical protein